MPSSTPPPPRMRAICRFKTAPGILALTAPLRSTVWNALDMRARFSEKIFPRPLSQSLKPSRHGWKLQPRARSSSHQTRKKWVSAGIRNQAAKFGGLWSPASKRRVRTYCAPLETQTARAKQTLGVNPNRRADINHRINLFNFSIAHRNAPPGPIFEKEAIGARRSVYKNVTSRTSRPSGPPISRIGVRYAHR